MLNSLKIALLALCFSCSYAVAKQIERPIITLSDSATQVKVQLINTDDDFKDLGITPEAMTRYIVAVSGKYSTVFKKETGLVAVAVEVSAHEPEKAKDCSDYTQCVMVKFFVKGDDDVQPLKITEMEKALFDVKEVEITNFQSQKKVSFVIYIRQ